jgi:uncharacterized protein with HEPN domain
MRDAAAEALRFMRGRTRDDLARDRMLALAVVRSREVIGEAASRVTASTRERTAEIPWQAVVGMRNRLIHGYFEIDYDRDTGERDLPVLLQALERALGPADA